MDRVAIVAASSYHSCLGVMFMRYYTYTILLTLLKLYQDFNGEASAVDVRLHNLLSHNCTCQNARLQTMAGKV